MKDAVQLITVEQFLAQFKPVNSGDQNAFYRIDDVGISFDTIGPQRAKVWEALQQGNFVWTVVENCNTMSSTLDEFEIVPGMLEDDALAYFICETPYTDTDLMVSFGKDDDSQEPDSKTLYVTNVHNGYYAVECSLNVSELVDCKIHASEQEMINYVAEVAGLDVEEISCAAYVIREFEGEYEVCDGRGIWSDIDLQGNTIEHWLSVDEE